MGEPAKYQIVELNGGKKELIFEPEEEPALLVEKKDGVMTLTLNRPKKYNAMNKEMYELLNVAVHEYRYDDSLKVCVIKGSPKTKRPMFTAGGDLAWFEAERAVHGEIWQPHFFAYDEMEKIDKPFIAAIDGMCIASGFNLAVDFCDFIICTERSTFGVPAIKRALRLHYPLMYTERMSLSNALYLTMTGKNITAERAREMGFVQEICANDKLDETVKAITDIIVDCAPKHLQAHKALLRHISRNPGSGQEMTDLIFGPLNSPEMLAVAKEGRESFLEKREANFNKK